MNELKGKCVNVVLGVREGRGFDFVKRPTYIVANFNGRPMESDWCETGDNPCFNTELVWETEKRDVRKARSSSTPLRVELCTGNGDDDDDDDDADRVGRVASQRAKREIVGFTLLSLRSAPVIVNCDLEIPYKWYKLLGTRSECKGRHPELYLSLTLRDHLINNELPRALPYVITDDVAEITTNLTTCCDDQQEQQQQQQQEQKVIVPVRFAQDGLMQIGDGAAEGDLFHFTVLMKSTYNLDLLLPKELVFGEATENYYLALELLGLTIKSKPFAKNLHKEVPLNDVALLKLQSSFELLKDFFRQSADVGVSLNYARQKLGSLRLHLNDLIPEITVDEYKEIYNGKLTKQEVAYFTSAADTLDVEKRDRRPCIEMVFALELVEKRVTDEVGAGERELSKKSSRRSVKSARNPSQTRIIAKEIEKHDADRPDLRRTFSSLNERFGDDNYKIYALIVALESVKWRRNVTEFSVVFDHPQARTKLIVTYEVDGASSKKLEPLALNAAKCKTYYVTSEGNLRRIIEAWPPAIRIISAQQRYDDIEFKCNGNETKCRTNLCDGGEIVADIVVSLAIEEFAIEMEDRNDRDRHALFPCVLDEEIAFAELKDYAKWKAEMKNKHAADLRRQEKEFVAEFKGQWTKRKNELERKLLDNINRCKTLNNQLKRTSIALKVKETCDAKRDELRCRETYAFEDEVYKNSLKYKHLTSAELIEKVTETKEENECLQEIIDEQQAEIEKFKKSSLTDEQTGNLLQELRALQEKYEDLQRSKNYFKDQWKKSVREIHRLKTEGQTNIQRQIRSNLEELSNLSLDSFLNVDRPPLMSSRSTATNDDIVEEEDFDEPFFGFCTDRCCSELNVAIEDE